MADSPLLVLILDRTEKSSSPANPRSIAVVHIHLSPRDRGRPSLGPTDGGAVRPELHISSSKQGGHSTAVEAADAGLHARLATGGDWTEARMRAGWGTGT